MGDITLQSEADDIFPRRLILRISHRAGRILVRWQWQQKPYSIEADSIEEAVREAVLMVNALHAKGQA